jgi:hypothetical protein
MPDIQCEAVTHGRGIEEEFATVKLLIESKSVTLGVDCFALALLKAERQIRRLFTYLVYQSDAFNEGHVRELINVLYNNDSIYFRHFKTGIQDLSGVPISTMVADQYERLNPRMEEASERRNKIFHGQLTGRSLTRDDLLNFVTDIQEWCQRLSTGAARHISYDGFSRKSFHKSSNGNIVTRVSEKIKSVDAYRSLLAELTKGKRERQSPPLQAARQ